jgi:homoserine O-acetyltransferase/O-succinyltransferase
MQEERNKQFGLTYKGRQCRNNQVHATIIKLLFLCLIICLTKDLSSQGQSVTSIGDLQLTNGAILKDCKLSYRIFGKLSDKKDNVVLLPTWFNGDLRGWIPFLGNENYVDTTVFAAIAIDAFGAGQSSSPVANGIINEQFPDVSIRDMVNAQYTLLKKHLGIDRLHAALGVSMGGMQVFEWGVAYPDYMEKLVSIEGTPKLASYDMAVWTTLVDLLSSAKKYGIPKDSVALQYARLIILLATTPEAANDVSPENLDKTLRNSAKGLLSIPFENALLQLKAMIAHNVSTSFNNKMDEVFRIFKAKLLVVASPDDHAVTMGQALEFAKAVSGETLIINSRCGHQVFYCEKEKIGAVVRKFLAQ